MDLHKPLLDRPVIRGFNFLKRVDSVKEKQLVCEQLSSVFKGLGKLEGGHITNFQDDAKPFAVTTP